MMSKLGGMAVRAAPKQPPGGDMLGLLAVLGNPKRVREAEVFAKKYEETRAANERACADLRELLDATSKRISEAEIAEANAQSARAALKTEREAAEKQNSAERMENSLERNRLTAQAAALADKTADVEQREGELRKARTALADLK